jgi:hypothetical protein
MKTLTAEEILALKRGMLVQATDRDTVTLGDIIIPRDSWLVTQPLIDGDLYIALHPMWHTELNFFTAEEMAEAKVIRIA